MAEPLSSPCHDCGMETTPCTGKRGCRHIGKWEYYTVWDSLWQKAVPEDGDYWIKALLGDTSRRFFLCIGCLERRLGRQLTADDFADLPINDPDDPWITLRLRDRLLA